MTDNNNQDTTEEVTAEDIAQVFVEHIQTVATFSQDPSLLQTHINQTPHFLEIFHGYLGLTTEVGELGDAIKKTFVKGKELDLTNVKEEVGDILWYLTLLSCSCGFTLLDAMQANSAKLAARHGAAGKFTTEGSDNRDLVAEIAAIRGE